MNVCPILKIAAKFFGIQSFGTIEVSHTELDPLTAASPFKNYRTRLPPQLRIDPRQEEPARPLLAFFRDFHGRVLIAAESAGRREMLLDMLRKRQIDPRVMTEWAGFVESKANLAITVSPISTGLVLDDPPIALIAEEQLFGERARQAVRDWNPLGASALEHRSFRIARELDGADA